MTQTASLNANPYSSAPTLAQALALPASAHIGQRIAKSLLIEQITNLPGTTPTDKRLANDLLAELHWLAALKPSTCGLAAWQTDTHSYLEIAVLHAILRPSPAKPTARHTAQQGRLFELIHRTIPYPVVLIISHPSADNTTDSIAQQLSLAHKRLPLGTSSAMVLEQVFTTKIIANYVTNTWTTCQFFQYIAFNHTASAPATHLRNLYARYSDWLHAIEALAAAEHTGQFSVSTTAPQAARRRSALAAYDQLDLQMASLRAQASKASQLAQRAALNLKIVDLMAQRQAIQSQL